MDFPPVLTPPAHHSSNMEPTPDFEPAGGMNTHGTVAITGENRVFLLNKQDGTIREIVR